MFLYLFNVCADGSNPYAGVPAGVLYMHAARSVMTVETKSSAEKDIAGQEDKAFGMNGIVITNPDCDIPAAMEHDLAGKYIPVRLKKSGVGGSPLPAWNSWGCFSARLKRWWRIWATLCKTVKSASTRYRPRTMTKPANTAILPRFAPSKERNPAYL